MLKNLHIKNYAIIDEINVEFNQGFNVFIGETGAGKSIIVDALSFLIKGKADTSIIKTGADKAIIEGVFSIEDYMKKQLDEADIDYDDELIVRRVISNDGHNSIKINQCSVTLSFLTDLLSEHIDIHSQKDSQFLLNKKNHLLLLDRYSKLKDELNNYKEAYNEYKVLLNEYNDLINNTYNESEIEYLKYDLDELKQANLDPKEEIELLEKEKRYKSAEQYITVLNNCINAYDNQNSIRDNLKYVIKELNINDDEIIKIKTEIENEYYNIDDNFSKLKKILSSFTDDDLDINFIEDRLYTYSKIKRKHNCNCEELIVKQKAIEEKLKFFENKDLVINEKKKLLDEKYNNALSIAKKLHQTRTNSSKKLEEAIKKETEDLMLNNVNFVVKINECDLNENGIDTIEFFISLNKGEDVKPLKDVASGGEISRLMLALKTIFTSLSDCTLAIFDEIDSGVSGKVGLAMGRKMKSISLNTQVISITHLASVAACANSHYYIYKEDNTKSSSTYIKQLNKEEIIQELANISVADPTQNAINAAKELYEIAQK